MRYSRRVDEDTALAFVKKYVKSATKTTDLPSPSRINNTGDHGGRFRRSAGTANRSFRRLRLKVMLSAESDRKPGSVEQICHSLLMRSQSRPVRPLVVAVTGLDCAGKTTLSIELESRLEALGAIVQIISIDDFLIPRADPRR